MVYNSKSSIIFTLSLVISILTCFFFSKGNAFSVVRSIKRNGMGDVDSFSNPVSTCSSVECLRVIGSAGCKPGDCCICKCSPSFPNYIVHRGTCVQTEHVDPACEMTTVPSDPLMAVKDFSRTGVVSFDVEIDHPHQCPGIELKKWYYQLDTALWNKGPSSFFRLISDGRHANRWNLQWDKGLERKYHGLILSFDFHCVGQQSRLGCLLVKSKGNYSLAGSSSNPPSTVGPSHVTMVTERKDKPTGGSPGIKGGVDNGVREENFTGQDRGVAGKNYSVVVIGVSLSIVMGIALICVVMLRNGGPLWLKLQQRPKDNEFYDAGCVLSIDGQTAEAPKRGSRLGPLPPLPHTKGEPIYEEPVMVRNVGYHGLSKENKPSVAPIQPEPVHTEPIHCKPIHSLSIHGKPNQTEAIVTENPGPFYNTLEELSDTDDYDDTTECHCTEL